MSGKKPVGKKRAAQTNNPKNTFGFNKWKHFCM